MFGDDLNMGLGAVGLTCYMYVCVRPRCAYIAWYSEGSVVDGCKRALNDEDGIGG